MKRSWLAVFLAIFLTGCSSLSTHKSKSTDDIAQAKEDAFYIPRPMRATGTDPMSTVYSYSKSDIIASVFFEFDKANPKREYTRRIKSAHKFFDQHPELNVLVVGHCDHFGEQAYNKKLGLKRAENVKSRLVKLGIDENRIVVASLGSEQAKETSSNKEITMSDRRVDIVSIENSK